MKKRAILKFNGGNLALLCSDCSVIMKVGYEFNEQEKKFAKGEIDNLVPLFCQKCINKNKNKNK
jgi:hypothetical protein